MARFMPRRLDVVQTLPVTVTLSSGLFFRYAHLLGCACEGILEVRNPAGLSVGTSTLRRLSCHTGRRLPAGPDENIRAASFLHLAACEGCIRLSVRRHRVLDASR